MEVLPYLELCNQKGCIEVVLLCHYHIYSANDSKDLFQCTFLTSDWLIAHAERNLYFDKSC